MHDLPSQTLLQQTHARPVSGEELEVFGKKAACRYTCGECATLNDAVVMTIKSAGLSPEQVKRVVEFTNQNAYLTEFKKESSAHKYIEFHGGPANPSEILKDLNDGGGGTVFDRGMADYASPPPEKTASILAKNRAVLGLEKVASVVDPREQALRQAFAAEDVPVPYEDPYQDSIAMREKLATIRDNLNSDLSFLETEYLVIGDDLYGQVKQAALEGTPLGHVIQAWQDVTPGEGYVKCAFQLIGSRLVEEGVFRSFDEVGASLEKTAGAQALPNHEHPVLKSFAAFCTQLDKLASVRAQRDEVADYFNRIDWFLKEAMQKVAKGENALKRLAGQGGLLGKVWGGAGRLGEFMSGPAEQLVGAIGGEGAGQIVGTVARHAPKAVLGLAGARGVKEVYDRGIKYGPGQIPLRLMKEMVPGTREYYIDQMNKQQGTGFM